MAREADLGWKNTKEVPMHIFLAICLWLLASVAVAEAPQATAATVMKGDVLYWEGEELVVKEISGREVRLHVNAETKITGAAAKLKTGDKIEAAVNSQGHAETIALQIPGVGSPSILP
jgi:hypothetical protein